ncbi:unnamed protein product, partial [Symbiodinium sp. CCMP2456]
MGTGGGESQGDDSHEGDDDRSSHPESGTDVAVRNPATPTPANKCYQCGQVDRYLLPKQVPLKWARVRQTEHGREPDGWECWGCEKTRCNKFGRISCQALRSARRQSTEIEDAFTTHREECGMPGSRVVKGDQVDVKSILKQQAYVDKFREGEWVPLLEYLVEEAGMRPADVDTLAKQMYAAEQVCKVPIHYDNRQPGVLLFKGNRKKVRVGCRTAAEKQQEDMDYQGDAEGVQRMFGERAQGLVQMSNAARNIDEVRRDVASHLQAREAGDQDAPGPEDANQNEAASQQMLDFNIFDMGGGTSTAAAKASNKRASKTPVPAAAAEPLLNLGEATGNGSQNGPPSPERPTQLPGKGKGRGKNRLGGGNPSGDLAGNPAKKPKQSEMDKADDLLRSTNEKFNDAMLWQSRPKKKEIDKQVKLLGDMASKVLSIGDDGGFQKSNLLNDRCLDLEAKFDLFNNISKNAKDFVTQSMEDTTLQILLNTEATVLNNIIVFTATETLKMTDVESKLEEGSKLFFKVCGFSSESIISVRLLKLKIDHDAAAAGGSVAQSYAADTEAPVPALQQVIFSMWLDRACRARIQPKFTAMVNQCPVPPVDFNKVQLSWKPPTSDIGDVAGEFSSLMKLDAQVLRTMLTDWSKATPLETFFAKMCVDLKGAFSVRLSSLLRSSTGTARTLWASLESAAKHFPTDYVKEMTGSPSTGSLRALLHEDKFDKIQMALGIMKSVEVLPQAHTANLTELDELRTSTSKLENLVRDYGSSVIGLLETHLTTDLWIQGKFKDVDPPENAIPPHSELAGLTKWLLHFEVYAGSAQQLQKLVALWAELESACLLRWTTEQDLTVDSFEKASKAIVRLQESAMTGELEQVLSLSGVPGVLKNVGAQMIACVRAVGDHKLQVKWLRRLLEAGHYEDIAKTENLRILYLGKDADGILRTLRSCSELIEIDVAAMDMTEKECMRTALKMYVQVKMAEQADVDAAGKQEAMTKLGALTDQLRETFNSEAAKYDETRQGRAEWVAQHASITSRLAEMDPSLFTEAAEYGKDEAFGAEDLWRIISSHEKDFEGTGALLDAYNKLKTSILTAPTVDNYGYLVSCIMLVELLLPDHPQANEIPTLAAQFYKYSASNLRTLKKQLPQKATEKLERIIKDSKSKKAPKEDASSNHGGSSAGPSEMPPPT